MTSTVCIGFFFFFFTQRRFKVDGTSRQELLYEIKSGLCYVSFHNKRKGYSLQLQGGMHLFTSCIDC